MRRKLKTHRIDFFLSKRLREAAEAMAALEDISLSELMRALVTKGAKEQGLWPPKEGDQWS